MFAEDIIIKPVLTEKGYAEVADKKYAFIVKKDANKTEIKIAVEKIFGVKVANVNTVNCKGKESGSSFRSFQESCRWRIHRSGRA